jgi:hypothetical protein
LRLLCEECEDEVPVNELTNLMLDMRSLFSTLSCFMNSPILRSQMLTKPSSLALAKIS